MRIFVFLGTILVIFILFTGHVLLVTKDAPDDSYLPSLESSISMLLAHDGHASAVHPQRTDMDR